MMGCACGHVIAGWGVIRGARGRPRMSTRRRRAPRPPPCARWRPRGRAHADQRSHEQAHVEGARVDEQSFEDVGVPAQMRRPHAPGLVEMGVGAFAAFATLALQGSAPCAADAAAIGVHRVSRRGVVGRCCMNTRYGWGGVARTSLDPPQEPHYGDEVEGSSQV